MKPHTLQPAEVVVEAHIDLDSTQERMRERIRAGENVHGHVVRAERQLAGSGTRGRAWSSGLGGSYQTLALRSDVGARAVAGTASGDARAQTASDATARDVTTRVLASPGVSVAVGLGIAEAFVEQGARLQVKWPNDLWYRGRKVGGILCEVFREWLMVGVGVNVANEPPPHGIALTGWSVARVHDVVIDGVGAGLDLWASGEPLSERFAPVDALAGRWVVVRAGGRALEGIVAGIADDGALRIGDTVVVSGTVASIGPVAPPGSV